MPKEMPEPVDPNDKKQLPDPNTWIYEAYDKLRLRINEIMDPLNAYLETLKKYSNEYKLNPQEIIKALDDDENPPEADVLRKDVIFHQKEANRLMTEIPDHIIVSMF
jgi:hypothetical protein